MAFDKETAKEAGQKSKRGKDTQLKEVRELFLQLLEGNKGKIQEWLDEVAKDNPAKAIELILKISSYVIPKPRPLEIKEQEEDSVITINFKD